MTISRRSNVEKVKILHEISTMNDEGATDHAIAKKLGVRIETIQRNQKYLKALRSASITPEETAEKRSEIYLKLLGVEAEAKKLFDSFKNPFICPVCKGTGVITSVKKKEEVKSVCIKCGGFGHTWKAVDAERFHKAWRDSIEQQSKLYGLNDVKSAITVNTQINNNSLPPEEDRLPVDVAKSLSAAIIAQHENKRITEGK